jgi:hypothetical protein
MCHFFDFWKKLNCVILKPLPWVSCVLCPISISFNGSFNSSNMSISIRISPQTSKVLAFETRSTGSDATVVRMRVTRTQSIRRRTMSPSSPLSSPSDAVIINIMHDAGGAKAPRLMHDSVCTNSP